MTSRQPELGKDIEATEAEETTLAKFINQLNKSGNVANDGMPADTLRNVARRSKYKHNSEV